MSVKNNRKFGMIVKVLLNADKKNAIVRDATIATASLAEGMRATIARTFFDLPINIETAKK